MLVVTKQTITRAEGRSARAVMSERTAGRLERIYSEAGVEFYQEAGNPEARLKALVSSSACDTDLK